MAAETMSIEMMAGMVRNATEASPAAPESCHAFFVQPYRSFYMAEEPEWGEEIALGVFSLQDLTTSGWCSSGCLFGEGCAVRWWERPQHEFKHLGVSRRGLNRVAKRLNTLML